MSKESKSTKYHPVANLSLGEAIAVATELGKQQDSMPAAASVLLLRNFTFEGIEPYLRAGLLRSGIAPTVAFGGFDTIEADLMQPGSIVEEQAWDFVVVAMIISMLDHRYEARGWSADESLSRQRSVLEAALTRTGNATIVVNTYPTPTYSEYGFMIADESADPIAQVEALNRDIRDFARRNSHRVLLLDIDRLARRIGEGQALSKRFWYATKSPFSQELLAAAADELTRMVVASKGLSKKCLVLDCDNTIWGGVVGEDGVDGIQLSESEYPGNAFYEFQQNVLRLVDKGVMVALCSKNNEADVFEVLDNHPASVIKREHLVGWKVNWTDKAQNLIDLAAQLNIGLDSMVFVDDSDVECERVMSALPQVRVLQVPSKPHELPGFLFRFGLFDSLTVSEEDRKRVKLYQAESQRQALSTSALNLDDFIASLGIVLEIQPLSEKDVARASQLCLRTNQFNLTTQRYTEEQIRGLMTSPDAAVYTLRVSDRFGDYGLTGLWIAKRDIDGVGRLDTLLMSCRVLGRGVDTQFVEQCLSLSSEALGAPITRGMYIPTAKNAQVKSYLEQFGFEPVSESEGRKEYELKVAVGAD